MIHLPSLILLLIPPLLFGQLNRLDFPLTPKIVTFTVVDSDGNPVEGALVEASKHGPGNESGLTGSGGRIILTLVEGANLSAYVTKEGYYTTGGELWRGGLFRGLDGNLVPRELPDAFTITLKAVRDPVPLRNARFRGNAPKSDEPIGFDLKTGDWVAPFGKGTTTDLFFRFHHLFLDDEAFSGTMTLSFPNPGDGIQPFQAARPFSMEFGSNLAPPHKAPVDGYLPGLTYTKAHREGEEYHTYEKQGRNYLFRTRTELDPNGTILAACYGWIQGEIQFDPRDPQGPQLSFMYYFNMDPDPEARSLEYDLHAPQSGR